MVIQNVVPDEFVKQNVDGQVLLVSSSCISNKDSLESSFVVPLFSTKPEKDDKVIDAKKVRDKNKLFIRI